MSVVSLNSALSGLKAAQRSLDIVSNNISNASTEGYTRKILPQESMVIGGVGVGVKALTVYRNVDKALVRDVMNQTSLTSAHSTTQEYLQRIQDFHGSSDSGRSISAKIGLLKDAFTDLSSNPDNNLALQKTLTAAQTVVSTFNDLDELVNQMRNQTEDAINSSVDDVNATLEIIARMNTQIATLVSQGQSAANLEDQRDVAIKKVASYMQVSTYEAENNKVVVMTKQGQTLADEQAYTLQFDKHPLSSASYYPGGGADGITILTSQGSTVDITDSGIGGKIGALFDLRDDTLPQYQAQIDELAQKIAYRFDQQGLRLFTDTDGNVPANVASPGAVSYVGFAGSMQVNRDIIADPTLIRSGTSGQTVLPGSNEIIRKVSEFAFGAYAYDQAQGSVDISAGTLYSSLGIGQTNQLVGSVDLTDYTPDLSAAPNISFPATFNLTIGAATNTITVNATDTATDLVNNINTAFGSNVASLNGLGQLKLDTSADITLSDLTIGAAGLSDLGLSFGAYAAQDPSFTVQVGTQSPVTVNISPGDTSTDLLNALNAIPGLTASLDSNGYLVMTPTEGGDLTVQNSVGTPIAALGLQVSGVSHTAFRSTNLGPGATLTTGLLATTTLEDFSRNMITAQGQDASRNKDALEAENNYLGTLEQRNSSVSGVNIDQEISELIRIQSNYAAAAKMITATERLFDELMQAFN